MHTNACIIPSHMHPYTHAPQHTCTPSHMHPITHAPLHTCTPPHIHPYTHAPHHTYTPTHMYPYTHASHHTCTPTHMHPYTQGRCSAQDASAEGKIRQRKSTVRHRTQGRVYRQTHTSSHPPTPSPHHYTFSHLLPLLTPSHTHTHRS